MTTLFLEHVANALPLAQSSSRVVSIQFGIIDLGFKSFFFFSQAKQEERRERIRSLPPIFREPINGLDKQILNTNVEQLVKQVQSGKQDPVEILTAYGKKALRAHEVTNCLTEVMISAAMGWARESNTQGPLAGIPVSLKDVRPLPTC